ncbi:MAG: hypothetical protein WC861_05360 [Candidatus Micrarchaeia archaeon]|jgi:hypothetical protein
MKHASLAEKHIDSPNGISVQSRKMAFFRKITTKKLLLWAAAATIAVSLPYAAKHAFTEKQGSWPKIQQVGNQVQPQKAIFGIDDLIVGGILIGGWLLGAFSGRTKDRPGSTKTSSRDNYQHNKDIDNSTLCHKKQDETNRHHGT